MSRIELCRLEEITWVIFGLVWVIRWFGPKIKPFLDCTDPIYRFMPSCWLIVTYFAKFEFQFCFSSLIYVESALLLFVFRTGSWCECMAPSGLWQWGASNTGVSIFFQPANWRIGTWTHSVLCLLLQSKDSLDRWMGHCPSQPRGPLHHH